MNPDKKRKEDPDKHAGFCGLTEFQELKLQSYEVGKRKCKL